MQISADTSIVWPIYLIEPHIAQTSVGKLSEHNLHIAIGMRIQSKLNATKKRRRN